MVKELLPNIKSATLVPESLDRRRPGRQDYVSPELVRLLRRENLAGQQSPVVADMADRDNDDLRTMAGVMTAIVLALPMWLGILLLVRYLIRL